MAMRDALELKIFALEIELDRLKAKPKRTQQFGHNESIANLEGEISGLRWALFNCFNEVSEPNIIEQ